MLPALLTLILSGVLSATPTSAPADRPCAQCHTGAAENPGRILIEFAAFEYTPGVQQQVKVHILQDRTPEATNFQMTARLASNPLANAGTFSGDLGTQVLTQNGLPYITNNSLNGTTVYTFNWTPPATNVGNIRFSVSAAGGDINGTPSGNAFTASYTMAPASLDLPAGFRRTPLNTARPLALSSNGRIASASGTTVSLLDANGNVTSFSLPGDVSAVAVNASGAAVGSYYSSNGLRSFLRSAAGTLTLFDVPGSRRTELTAINDSGQVFGSFVDDTGRSHVIQLTTPPAFTTFDVSTRTTVVGGVSNSGLVSGSVNRAGFVIIDDVPIGYLTCGREFREGTVIAAVNDQRYIAGTCIGTSSGGPSFTTFLQAPNGRRLSINSIYGEISFTGINNSLQTIASYEGARYLLTPCQVSPAPTLTVVTAPAAGGDVAIPVVGSPGCIPNAVSDLLWVTVPTTSLSTPDRVVVSVSRNSDGSTRSGSVWVAGSLVTIQQPSVECSFQVSGPNVTFPAQGGTGTLNITSTGGCSWTASSSASWLVPNAISGSGSTLDFTLQPNSGTQSRTGTLRVGTTDFTITQAGAPACSYTLTSNSSIPANGGTITVNVTTGTGCPWTAQSPLPGVTFQNGTGTVSSTFNATIPANTTNATRQVTVAARTGSISLPQPSTQAILSGLRFVPITPCRIADSRTTTTLALRETRNFAVQSSACNIPPTARAYSLNATVVPSGLLAFLTVFPAGQSRPNTSTLNSWNGRVVANAAIVEAGTNGNISVYAENPTHVILDINGYFVDRTVATGLAFYPVPPCRIADTRGQPRTAVLGPIERSFQIRGVCGVPATAQAYSLNLTAVPDLTLIYATVYPTGQARPNASTLNSFDGQVVPNAAIVPAGTGGQINVYGTDAHDVVLDINGYFAPPGLANALAYTPVTPCRVADTRDTTTISLGASETRAFSVAGICGTPTTARAFVLNTTAVPGLDYLGYVSFWPQGLPQPLVSTLNSFNGQVVANLAIVPNGLTGAINAFASNPTHLVLDTSGYFAPDPGN